MIKRFLNLEWKQFFRSSYWQNSLVLNIFMGLLALYFLVSFLVLGIAIYPGLKKLYPDKDPLVIVNSVLIFVFLADIVVRYFLQKLPTMQVKSLLVLPISKKRITHYVLGKSALSFFNILSLVMFMPFSFMLLINGYDKLSVVAWFVAVFSVTMSVNYLNFLINKKNTVFIAVVLLFAGIITLVYFDIFPVGAFFGKLFNAIVANPVLAIVPLLISFVLYYINFKDIHSNLYLDDVLKKKQEKVNTSDLSWAANFGDTAVFLKNDIRLIWRNKRPKMVFFMSFIFLPYGLLFFTNPAYAKMPIMFVFVAIFTTGMFVLNFGQFIPAWDSAYYKLLMSQNIRYRKYLESKWILMATMTAIMFLLSIPYVYFGVDKLLLFIMSLFFNIGFTSLFVLFMGAFNRKSIDLSRSAMMNYQGTSGKQFFIAFFIMLFPMGLFYVVETFFGFNAGIATLSGIGLIGIIFRNYFMDKIEQQYIKNKHLTIHAFKQTN